MGKQKTFIRKIKQGDKIRYAEVWNERKGKKVIQHHVRYLGSDPNDLSPPSSFDIEKVHFGYLAQLIMSDDLSAEDVYVMLDGMGESVERRDIKSIILRYDLVLKKTRLQLIGRRNRSDTARFVDDD